MIFTGGESIARKCKSKDHYYTTRMMDDWRHIGRRRIGFHPENTIYWSHRGWTVSFLEFARMVIKVISSWALNYHPLTIKLHVWQLSSSAAPWCSQGSSSSSQSSKKWGFVGFIMEKLLWIILLPSISHAVAATKQWEGRPKRLSAQWN